MEEDETANEKPRLELALGTAQWSGYYGINNTSGAPEFHTAREMLDLARRTGIATLDTARGYGDSEALIGACLEAQGEPKTFEVVTKLAPDVARIGGTAAQALANTGRSLARSRKALGRDELDAVLLHRFAHLGAFDGAIWRRLRREREVGTIRALGVSAANPLEAWAALEHPEVELLQVATSLLDQRLARGNFFEAAAEAGKRVFVRSVFLQGLAFVPTRKLPRALRGFTQPLDEIRGATAALGCSVETLFLSYVATLPGCTAVVGCETPEQLRGILEATTGPRPSRASLHRLAARIAPLPDRLLDPSKWSELSAPSAVQLPMVAPAA